MSCQGNLDLNFQAQQINQNQLLPPMQANQIDNPQPYIDPNYINQNQNGIYVAQNNNMQIPLNNGAYPNNYLQVQTQPNMNARCNDCNGCKIVIISCSIVFLIFIILFVIIICNGGFGSDEVNCNEDPDHRDCQKN